jgi:hypothetical protein
MRELIRREIRSGTIGVRPWPGDSGRVRIIAIHIKDG